MRPLAMPTLPLFQPPATANAWHDVRSPGGYEGWRFDVEDASGQLQVIVTFFQGSPFSRAYRSAYERYRRRPTRHAPPTPADWPGVGLLIRRSGYVIVQREQFVTPSQFSASRDTVSVAVGGSTIQRLSSGEYRVRVELPGCAVRMTLNPIAQPPIEERTLVDHPRARHRWILAAPLCRAEATIEMGSEPFAFRGLGYHDHVYGTAPLHEAAKRLFLCRLLRDDRAILLRLAQGTEPSRPDDLTLLDVSRGDLVERPVDNATFEWSHNGLLHPGRPKVIRAGALTLQRAQTVLATRSRSHLTYDLTAGPIQGIASAMLVQF